MAHVMSQHCRVNGDHHSKHKAKHQACVASPSPSLPGSTWTQATTARALSPLSSDVMRPILELGIHMLSNNLSRSPGRERDCCSILQMKRLRFREAESLLDVGFKSGNF